MQQKNTRERERKSSPIDTKTPEQTNKQNILKPNHRNEQDRTKGKGYTE